MKISDKSVACFAAASGFGGLTAAAACCVLPLALAGVGIGASGLAWLVPFFHPLSAIALLAVIGGWFLYFGRRRNRAVEGDNAPPATTTLVLLIVASTFVALSAAWHFIEAPLMSSLGG